MSSDAPPDEKEVTRRIRKQALEQLKGADVRKVFSVQPVAVKNKISRAEMRMRQRQLKARLKRIERGLRKQARAKGELSEGKQKTLESERTEDATIVQADDEEVAADQACDEFADLLDKRVSDPKIVITTSRGASKEALALVKDLVTVFPKCAFYQRRDFDIDHMVKQAIKKEYTALLIVNEGQRRTVTGLTHVHLPVGPTAYYRLKSVMLGKEIRGHAAPIKANPELVLNNFNTRLGHRVARLFQSLFPEPQLGGRQAVTLHNQRDFMFFRRHRYIFDKKDVKKPDTGKIEKEVVARVQEIGPRFTLKLEALQRGVFDPSEGEFEWVRSREKDRRRFNL
ncbi:MAG: hypothetical protein MHM6MM_003168 [Cercozoa sp. M6MM]